MAVISGVCAEKVTTASHPFMTPNERRLTARAGLPSTNRVSCSSKDETGRSVSATATATIRSRPKDDLGLASHVAPRLRSCKHAGKPFPAAHAQVLDGLHCLRVPRRRSWRRFREKIGRNRGEPGTVAPLARRPAGDAERAGRPRSGGKPRRCRQLGDDWRHTQTGREARVLCGSRKRKRPTENGWALNSGGLGRNRTTDTRIFSPLLYRLSYRAKALDSN